MNKKTTLAAVLTVAVVMSGCITSTAKATYRQTPGARVTECDALCTGLGMKLSAFVVIMNSSGCVCEPNNAQKTSAAGAGAASGGAMIAAAAAALQQQQAAAVTP
jgi:hypothetical protein